MIVAHVSSSVGERRHVGVGGQANELDSRTLPLDLDSVWQPILRSLCFVGNMHGGSLIGVREIVEPAGRGRRGRRCTRFLVSLHYSRGPLARS